MDIVNVAFSPKGSPPLVQAIDQTVGQVSLIYDEVPQVKLVILIWSMMKCHKLDSWLGQLALGAHILGYWLGQLVSLIYGRGTRVPLGALQLGPQRQLGFVREFSPPCPRFSLPDFLLLSHYSCVCFFLLLHPCCFHARSIPCGIHTPCMEAPFPAVHTRWSLVFLSDKA